VPEPVRAAGPLGTLFRSADGRLDGPSGDGANALIMLNKLAFFDVGARKLDDVGRRALLRWACEEALGQAAPMTPRGAAGGLMAAVSARRAAALHALAEAPRCHVRLRAEPEWRLAVGLGDKANAHEIGLALHGTYGWPVIPGSALKGLAAAWAASSGVGQGDIVRVLGGPRPGDSGSPAGQGSVRFLDALPLGRPVTVAADVLTPHVKPYYDSIATGASRPVPPAEYHSPVPLMFLTVRGPYAVDLYGSCENDLGLAAEWLAKAGDELGAGAKTAAGYGYLALTPAPGAP
jgi:CRISPR/Cas system CMR subunit Cmr6 (Cas7 group RAMP superfamily)